MKRLSWLGLILLAGCAQQPVVSTTTELALNHTHLGCQPSSPSPASARVQGQPQPQRTSMDNLETQVREALARRNQRLGYEKDKVSALIACQKPTLLTRSG